MNESGVFVFPGTLFERRDLAATIAQNCTTRERQWAMGSPAGNI